MAYKVIILYQLYMPSYFLGTFTEYPLLGPVENFPTIKATRNPVIYVIHILCVQATPTTNVRPGYLRRA